MNLPTTINLPSLVDGEYYAGIIIGKNDEPSYHLVGLPGEKESVTWAQALKWAKSVGGDLPDRRELNLARANAREHFQDDWYWSNEQHASYSDYAWCQGFSYGYQDSYHKSARLRARAVRRVPIQ